MQKPRHAKAASRRAVNYQIADSSIDSARTVGDVAGNLESHNFRGTRTLICHRRCSTRVHRAGQPDRHSRQL